MRELNVKESYAVSGGGIQAELNMLTDGILAGIAGYAAAMFYATALQVESAPFYPTLVCAAYGFFVSSQIYG